MFHCVVDSGGASCAALGLPSPSRQDGREARVGLERVEVLQRAGLGHARVVVRLQRGDRERPDRVAFGVHRDDVPLSPGGLCSAPIKDSPGSGPERIFDFRRETC